MYLGSGNKEAGRVYIYTLNGVRQQQHGSITFISYILWKHSCHIQQWMISLFYSYRVSCYHPLIFLCFLFFVSPRRTFLYPMERWSQTISPRMPGLVMHWHPLQIWTMMASRICWWEPHWRMNTGGPSMFITETVFMSSTTINRYPPFYNCKFYWCISELRLIPVSLLITADSCIISFPLPAVFWPKFECSIGFGWRWSNRLGSGSAGKCCTAQVGRMESVTGRKQCKQC